MSAMFCYIGQFRCFDAHTLLGNPMAKIWRDRRSNNGLYTLPLKSLLDVISKPFLWASRLDMGSKIFGFR